MVSLATSIWHCFITQAWSWARLPWWGMGAVFAGIIRAPITSVLIIFEMTGSYELILPLMISNMTAYALARHVRPTPIYEALLEQDDIHLPHRDGRVAHALERLRGSGCNDYKPGNHLWPTSVYLKQSLKSEG